MILGVRDGGRGGFEEGPRFVEGNCGGGDGAPGHGGAVEGCCLGGERGLKVLIHYSIIGVSSSSSSPGFIFNEYRR